MSDIIINNSYQSAISYSAINNTIINIAISNIINNAIRTCNGMGYKHYEERSFRDMFPTILYPSCA